MLTPAQFSTLCEAIDLRAYGRVFAAIIDSGRKPRGVRSVDPLIAATALAHSMPPYTRIPDDFIGLEKLIEIRES